MLKRHFQAEQTQRYDTEIRATPTDDFDKQLWDLAFLEWDANKDS